MSSADTKNTDAIRADETSPVDGTCIWTEWLVDSGATDHCTRDRSVFASYSSNESQNRILRVANGESLKIIGVGDVCFRTSLGVDLMLTNVLHVPGLTPSYIMSVPALDKEGYTSFFDRGKYRLTRGSLVVAEAELIGKKYFVRGTVSGAYSNLWHKRLEVGLVRQPCRKSDFLRLVYIALRGPLPNPSLSGSVYFVTLVDDYSRKTWCYALKRKREVVNAFKEFRSYAEGQKGKRVKCVLYDQVYEYALQGHCIRRDISYFCALPNGVPYVNNLAGIMSNNIMNRLQQILANAKLPWPYWDLALSAMVHVLNLCPAPSSNNDVPDKIWFGKDVSYDHLRVFGCRALVRVATDKTQQECVFVGYADNGVGYKFYDPLKKEVIFSSDAEFFEEQCILDIDRGKEERQDAVTTTSQSLSPNTAKQGLFKYLRKFIQCVL